MVMARRKALPPRTARQVRAVRLSKVIRNLTQDFPAIEEVYLFGSRRHQTRSKRSDIDLLVRSKVKWWGAGTANKLWNIEEYLDIFATDDAGAESLANGSRIQSSSFSALVKSLDAVPLWSNGNWTGTPELDLQHVLRDYTPIYTTIDPILLDDSPVLIVCALKKEFDAVCARLKNSSTARSYSRDRIPIRLGYVRTKSDNERIVAVTVLPRMGNVHAALITADAIDSVRPATCVLTGIAAGLQSETQIGDILVPEVVVEYEAVKTKTDGKAFQGAMPPMDGGLVAQIKAWDGAQQWIRQWTQKRAAVAGASAKSMRDVELHFDVMASGDKVVADPNEAQALKTWNRKIISIEMESHGFSVACASRNVRAIVIKAVSDYADADKNDSFHEYCCASTASFVARLIRDEIL